VTVNAFVPVSLAPPLVLVCLQDTSSAARTVVANGGFAINVLSADQEWLSRWFAWAQRPRGLSAFRDIPFRVGVTGAPILAGTACFIEASLVDVRSAGDHRVLTGEVLDFGADATREPLVFHAGRYRVARDREVDRSHGAADDPLSLTSAICEER
jgi:flavin reductase (DIM6/NTAB) family NADH-FMN oxidoreductase RutF